MSRIYDLELSCGCLIGTVDDIYMPCLTDKCVADKEYFKKTKKTHRKCDDKYFNKLKEKKPYCFGECYSTEDCKECKFKSKCITKLLNSSNTNKEKRK